MRLACSRLCAALSCQVCFALQMTWQSLWFWNCCGPVTPKTFLPPAPRKAHHHGAHELTETQRKFPGAGYRVGAEKRRVSGELPGWAAGNREGGGGCSQRDRRLGFGSELGGRPDVTSPGAVLSGKGGLHSLAPHSGSGRGERE